MGNLGVEEMFEKKNIRVLPDDTDAYGRLNWLAYLRYCEEAELGVFEEVGFSIFRFYKERKISFPRRAATFEYCAQVSPDCLIDVETAFKKVGKTSFTMLHNFYKKNSEDGERIFAASAQVTVVAYDHQLLQKTELPNEFRELLKRYVSAEPIRSKPQCAL